MPQQPGLGFGNHFTPHMVIARWSKEDGWPPAEVVNYSDLVLAPSALVLHYGQAIFEGLKAYARPDGSASIFRPDRCAERFGRSAKRMKLPVLPEEHFIRACERLVQADMAYVPSGLGQSLYLRPLMIGTEGSISVRASNEYLFVVLGSPTDGYFSGEVDKINVWGSSEYVRATAGGTGAIKVAGNYAASLIAKDEASRHGCQEILWLDAVERRWVEELSAMNFFAVFQRHDGSVELTTPPLSGTILDGNTRDSILQYAKLLGIQTSERPISLAEIASDDSPVIEAFACGTAATVVPIVRVTTHAGCRVVGNGEPGQLTMQLRGNLLDIQEGRAADIFGWMHDVQPLSAMVKHRPFGEKQSIG